ncbi:hypothetical protein GCM10020255_087450 [Rhodococcus baikonurensis]
MATERQISTLTRSVSRSTVRHKERMYSMLNDVRPFVKETIDRRIERWLVVDLAVVYLTVVYLTVAYLTVPELVLSRVLRSWWQSHSNVSAPERA